MRLWQERWPAPAHALEVTVTRKNRVDCWRQGIKFIPLAVESLGGWNELAVVKIWKLAAALTRQTGQDEKESRSHLVQRPSILLVRGNCALFMNCIPEIVPEDIDGRSEMFFVSFY